MFHLYDECFSIMLGLSYNRYHLPVHYRVVNDVKKKTVLCSVLLFVIFFF